MGGGGREAGKLTWKLQRVGEGAVDAKGASR